MNENPDSKPPRPSTEFERGVDFACRWLETNILTADEVADGIFWTRYCPQQFAGMIRAEFAAKSPEPPHEAPPQPRQRVFPKNPPVDSL